MIHIIEDDPIFADLIKKAAAKVDKNVQIFHNAIDAIQNLDETPNLIFLDILLIGPDGFTYLNELASYPETNQIPVVIVTSLDLKDHDLKPYGVVKILDKATMKPADIISLAREYARS